jgi:hypothetical protein
MNVSCLKKMGGIDFPGSWDGDVAPTLMEACITRCYRLNSNDTVDDDRNITVPIPQVKVDWDIRYISKMVCSRH